MRDEVGVVIRQMQAALTASAGLLLPQSLHEGRAGAPRCRWAAALGTGLGRGAASCPLGAQQQDAGFWVVSMLVILLIVSAELLP